MVVIAVVALLETMDMEAYPFAVWGALVRGTTQKTARGGTLTFNRTLVGWRVLRFIHMAFLRDLWPNKK